MIEMTLRLSPHAYAPRGGGPRSGVWFDLLRVALEPATNLREQIVHLLHTTPSHCSASRNQPATTMV